MSRLNVDETELILTIFIKNVFGGEKKNAVGWIFLVKEGDIYICKGFCVKDAVVLIFKIRESRSIKK